MFNASGDSSGRSVRYDRLATLVYRFKELATYLALLSLTLGSMAHFSLLRFILSAMLHSGFWRFSSFIGHGKLNTNMGFDIGTKSKFKVSLSIHPEARGQLR